jgi:hypothetical protein
VAVLAHGTSDLTSPSDGHIRILISESARTSIKCCFASKSRLLGAAAEAKFVREHKIYSFGRGTQNCRR